MSDCRRKLSNLTFDPETIAKGQENSGEWELDQKCVNVCVCVFAKSGGGVNKSDRVLCLQANLVTWCAGGG